MLQLLAHLMQSILLHVQTTDPNNPEEKQWDEELVSINGPWDAVFKKPGDYVELDVGTGPALADLACFQWHHLPMTHSDESMRQPASLG